MLKLAIVSVCVLLVALVGAFVFASIADRSVSVAEAENLPEENETARGVRDVGDTIISVLPWLAFAGVLFSMIYFFFHR